MGLHRTLWLKISKRILLHLYGMHQQLMEVQKSRTMSLISVNQQGRHTQMSPQNAPRPHLNKVMCYNVEFKPKSGDKWGTACTVKVPEATVPNLNPNEAYLFRVLAINEKGKSEPKDLGLPVVAKDVAIEPSINLLFTTYSVKVGDDLTLEVPVRGRPKPVVSWKKDSLPLKQTSSLTIINTATSSKIVIKGASREHVGKYEITLANTAGTVTASIGVVVLDKPGPPKGIKVDAVTSDSITLSWSPPEYDGGCSISNYIVEKRDTNTQEWQIVASNVARTSFKAGRLTHGSTTETWSCKCH
uniref:Titin n=1 Tax=Poecilia mexicana TaxID=48701 RepID=A0A3B3WVU3_9TELE